MATIYKTLLAKGYLPKELPPHFSSELFASYATTKRGRANLERYQPSDNFTRYTNFRLALPGQHRRQLPLIHPSSFSTLAQLVAKNFRRLLKKAARSPFSRSRPVYEQDGHRALRPAVKPSNLSRERTIIRAGSSHLLKIDISQFYPSLYTHAVGWAIDSKLRHRRNWRNSRLLGKKVDQSIMNLQGKMSHGIPIGNDISFLLAEVVLAQVDRALKLPRKRAYRWFDDYEIACDSQEEAEKYLALLTKELDTFRLHLNPQKTNIVRLPSPSQLFWQTELLQRAKLRLQSAREMVEFFDLAFSLREQAPDEPILLYALAILFKIDCPTLDVADVALSGVTQSLLAEPGCAQKAFSLLTFWHLNGFLLDIPLIARTVDQMLINHKAIGVSSDISWALAFCLQNNIALSAASGRVLSAFEDDCVIIQSLDMHAQGLLPKGFSTHKISRDVRNSSLDDAHWLVTYESHRHGFLSDSASLVVGNPLFSDLLAKRVTFYRRKMPAYAMIIHPGGAPLWVVREWLIGILQPEKKVRGEPSSVVKAIAGDMESIKEDITKLEDVVLHLLDRDQKENFDAVEAGEEPYA